jgi:hypothetical protein
MLAELRPSVSVGGIEALLENRSEPGVTLLSGTWKPLVLRHTPQPPNLRPRQVTEVTEIDSESLCSWTSGSWGSRACCSLSLWTPLLQLSFVAVSAVAECDHPVSEVRTWLVTVVTLTALWSGALCLTYVAAAAAVSAPLPAAAAAHSGAAPPDSVCPLRYECPSEAVPRCRALLACAPTPSAICSSSSSARLSPYPSAYHLPFVREKGRRL